MTDQTTGPAAARFPDRMFYPGNRVRVLPEQDSGDAVLRGFITHNHDVTPAGAEVRVFEYEVRLDRGGTVRLPVDRIERVSELSVLGRLSPRWTGSGFSTSPTVVEQVAAAVRRDEWNRGHPDTPYGQFDDAPSATVDDLLDALALMDDYRRSVDATERYLIAEARAQGATWDEIGYAFGCRLGAGRQSATGRYRRRGGDPKAAVPREAAPPASPAAAVPADDWKLPGDDHDQEVPQ